MCEGKSFVPYTTLYQRQERCDISIICTYIQTYGTVKYMTYF